MLAGITAQFMSPLWFFQVQDLGCLLAVSKCMSLDSAEKQNQCRERETKTERNINTQRKRFIILLHITDNIIYYRASLVAQLIRNPSAMQETLVQFLGWEVPLEKGYSPIFLGFSGGSAQNPSAVQETYVQSLGWEDPVEEGMGTHSSILPRESPWMEEPGRL